MLLYWNIETQINASVDLWWKILSFNKRNKAGVVPNQHAMERRIFGMKNSY